MQALPSKTLHFPSTNQSPSYQSIFHAIFYRLNIFSIVRNRKDMKSSTQTVLPKRKPRAVSSFLKKTYQLLNDQQNSHIVKWATNGIGFIVVNQDNFCKEVLPKYFKHSNYSSFVRQLNMYNFHKIRENNSESYFHHQCFDRLNEEKLVDIKRKPEKKKRKNEESDSEISDHEERSHSRQILTKKIKEEVKGQRVAEKVPSLKKIEEQKNTRHFVSEQQYMGQQCSMRNIRQQIDDDKLSINNDISQRVIPRLATRQLINPSNSNLYPFGAGKGQTSTFCFFY